MTQKIPPKAPQTALETPTPLILTPKDWHEVALLDSGHGRKLEQIGAYRFIRPEPQALWPPALDKNAWQNIDGEFIPSANQKNDPQNDSQNDPSQNANPQESGRWKLAPHLPPAWTITFEGLKFAAMPTPFRHLGFFPEQAPHWQYCAEHCRDFIRQNNRPPKILNLFGYTGIASLHAAINGAQVTHIDASKKAIAQAFDNKRLAGLDQAPIRLITDDARAFVKREARRQKRYDGIILDPPKYGRGPKGDIWRMEDDIAPLLADCTALLSPQARFVILTAYAIRNSFLSLHHLMQHTIAAPKAGTITSGELAIEETTQRRFKIAQALFARWEF